MRTRLNLYTFSRILKINIHPGKLHCFFFFVVVLFLFLFSFSPDLPIANDQTSIICLLISVTATFSLKIVVEWRRSSFDLTTSLRFTFWLIKEKPKKNLKRDGRPYGQNLLVPCGWNFWHLFSQVIPTKDRLEGLRAFKEKRTPQYTGE